MSLLGKNPPAGVLNEKKLYVFDMDGTIYLGKIVFDFAIRFIDHLRASGRRVLFFTNNASHSTEFYVDKLTRLGFGPTPEEIMTSGDVTVAFLKSRYPGKKVYLVGTEQLCEHFRGAGINLINGHEDEYDTVDLVVSSFDTELTYHKLDAACRLVRNGAVYLCTHPDFNCPTEDGFIPDSGAIAALVTASTGVAPTYFGKPYETAAGMMSEISGVPFDRMCVFGDRLYTDIAAGEAAGVDTVFVLSGEGTLSDLDGSDVKPSFVMKNIRELCESI